MTKDARPPEPGAVDLRERRRRRARARVQDVAIGLFAEQGYAGTTVEQIAAAADISPATFYRYFPRKEDAVLYDRVDADVFAAFVAAPARLGVLDAFRHAMHEVDSAMPAELRRVESVRMTLALQVPEVRAGMIQNALTMVEGLVLALHERTGLPEGDPRPRVWAGALYGVVLAHIGDPLVHGELDPTAWGYVEAADRALALMEEHLPLKGEPPAHGGRGARDGA